MTLKYPLIVSLIIVSLFLSIPNNSMMSSPEFQIEMDRQNQVMKPAEINFTRAEWKGNSVINGEFEKWYSDNLPYSFNGMGTTEMDGWYAESPWPVYEGSRSLGFHVRTLNPNQVSINQITMSNWTLFNNPTNLTIKLDYYIENVPNPSSDNAFFIQLKFYDSSIRYLNYYFAGQPTLFLSNSSVRSNIIIDSQFGMWHAFERNLTQDYFDSFAAMPIGFYNMYIYVKTVSDKYARAFIDDVNLVNGSFVKIGGNTNHGNFETSGTGTNWTWNIGDPGVVSKSSDSIVGNWSVNATVISKGNDAYAEIIYNVGKMLNSQTPGILSMSWRLIDLQGSGPNASSYLRLDCQNGTGQSFTVYYMFTYGGSTPPFSGPDSIVVNVPNFNTTGSWQTFSRNIFDDVTAVNQTTNLFISGLSLRAFSREPSSRISILFDNLSIIVPYVNGASFEEEGDIGDEIKSWSYYYVASDPAFTVTNESYTGNKAANLTVINGDYFSMTQNLNKRPLSNRTELYLDWSWRLDNITSIMDEYVMLLVYTSAYDIAYVMGNSSLAQYSDEADAYIVLPEANVLGGWVNTVRELYADYVSLFGAPSDSLYLKQLVLVADSWSQSEVNILLDDLYLYYDPEPYLSNPGFSPLIPTEDQAVSVQVTAIDPSLDKVLVYYRADGGTWQTATLTAATGNMYTGEILAQASGTLVEFYFFANDTYQQTTNLMNGSEYFSYSVQLSATSMTTTTTTTTTPNDTTTSTTTSPTENPLDSMLALVYIAGAVALVIVVILIMRSKGRT